MTFSVSVAVAPKAATAMHRPATLDKVNELRRTAWGPSWTAIALATGVPDARTLPPETPFLLLVAGLAYSGGLYTAYRALTVGKVSIVAPIVAAT